ncbi:MAG TPA: hypothetical protein DD435_05790 [Cyanobacteria bacterium UBA8530]|nr:hypothetical protein [Cyanobacteria bacterium UBA8530]
MGNRFQGELEVGDDASRIFYRPKGQGGFLRRTGRSQEDGGRRSLCHGSFQEVAQQSRGMLDRS